MKNFFKNKFLKRALLSFSLVLVIMGGVFVYKVLASEIVTPASGGSAVSIDTTSYTGGSQAWTNLTGLKITEVSAGDIHAGQYTLTLPDEWEFDITQTVTINTIGHGLTLSDYDVLPSSTSTLEFYVNFVSASSDSLTFSSIKVRPIGFATSTGNILLTNGTITGVDANQSFGTLTTIAGTATKLGFVTQPADTVYGNTISNVVVESQDQFGNFSTAGLAGENIITITKTGGTGTLSGNTTMDIGTSGIVTYTDLKIGSTGAVGTGKKLTATPASGLAAIESTGFEITARPITITATTNTKEYDGNTTATALPTITSGELASGDVGVYAETYDNKTATTGKTITPSVTSIKDNGGAGADMAGNYTITLATTTGDIAPLVLTVTGITVADKTYEGSTTSTLDVSGATSSGIISGDTATIDASAAIGTFPSKNVGTHNVTIAGVIATGADADNYTITQPTDEAAISKAALTVTAPVVTKIYDGTTDATGTSVYTGLVSGDAVNVMAVLTFDTKTVGTANKIVTPKDTTIKDGAGDNMTANYTISYIANEASTINKRLITLTAATNTKGYDGNTTATALPTITSGELASGDVGVYAETYDNKTATTGKVLTPSVTSILNGEDSMVGNYDITLVNDTTGAITPLALTVTGITAADKTYDGLTTSVLTTTGATSSGIISGDTATIDASAAIGTFPSKNVGSHTVTIAGVIATGTDALNYTITQPTDTADISAKAINVTAQTDTKVYDGNNSSLVSPVGDALISGDTYTSTGIQTFINKSVGASKDINATGAVINDGNSGSNYAITYVKDSTGEITAKGLTISGVVALDKVYDSTTNATLNVTSAALVGIVPLDTVNLSGAPTGAFDNATVGSNKTVTISGYSLSGADASNYSLTQPTDTADITKATPTITWTPANVVAGVAISEAQLNPVPVGVVPGTLAGSFVYDPVSGTVFTIAQTETLSAVFTPTDTTNYNTTSTSTLLTVIPAAASKLALSASPTSLAMGSNTTLTVTVQDTYGNTVTSDDSTIVILSTDNATFSGDSRLTVTDGVKTTTLTKVSAGNVQVNAQSGILTPAPTVSITFTSTADETNPIISGVSATTTQTTASITFQSNENGQGKISYYKTGYSVKATEFETIIADTPKTIVLDELVCNTLYNYSVNVKDSSSNDATPVTGTITTLSCTGPDVTPPPVPTINTTATTTDSNSYVITGAVGVDTPDASIRTVSVYNGEVLAGTANVPIGQTIWTVYVNLNQDVENSFTAVASDPNGNTSSASSPVVITEDSDAGVDTSAPTFVNQNPVSGSTSVSVSPNLYISFDEALDFNSIGSTTVMLCLVEDTDCSSPVDIGSPMLTELGKVIRIGGPDLSLDYNENYWIKVSGVKNLAGLTADDYGSYTTSYFTTETAPAGSFSIDNPIERVPIASVLPNNNYANGWEWVMTITLPTDENVLALKFSNWVSGSNTLAVAGNMEYYSEQITSGTGSEGSPISIETANAYPNYLTIINDADANRNGIQTKMHIKVKIPSSTVAGSYTTSYTISNQEPL